MTSPSTQDNARLGSGTGYTLLAASGFAAVSILTTLATRTGISLATVLAWRYMLGAVVLVTWVGAHTYPKRMRGREATMWMLVGGGGQALLVYLALSSLAYITAATLAFLFYTYPAWVALVQVVRRAERLDARRIAALVLSFAGIAVMVGGLDLRGAAAKGVMLALGAAVVYGAFIPMAQWMQKDWPVTVTSAYSKIGAAICFLTLSGIDGSFQYALTASAWSVIIVLTLWSTVLPGVFFLMGLMRLGPVRTAIVSTVEPFLTALLGVAVLGQPLTARTIAGGAAIVAAVIVLQFRRTRVA